MYERGWYFLDDFGNEYREIDTYENAGQIECPIGDFGMGNFRVYDSNGYLREDTQYDYKFVCLSHNTLRGAAGGGVLLAELLAAKGYLD